MKFCTLAATSIVSLLAVMHAHTARPALAQAEIEPPSNVSEAELAPVVHALLCHLDSEDIVNMALTAI